MFERFTNQARKVVVLAQDEARRLRHDTIGTEHVLLGLLAEGEGLAARALEKHGVHTEALERVVLALRPSGDVTPEGYIRFSERAKKSLESSLREALGIGHNYIGTEHLLLGLVHDRDCTAARILGVLGSGIDALRQDTFETMRRVAEQNGSAQGKAPDPLESFDGPSRTVVSLAWEEARAHRHDHVGTEHLLLGFLHTGKGDNDVARIMVEYGVTLSLVLRDIDERTGRGDGPLNDSELPLDQHARLCMRKAHRERLQRNHQYLAPAHLLIGMLRTPESTGARILTDAGMDVDTVRHRLLGPVPERTDQ